VSTAFVSALIGSLASLITVIILVYGSAPNSDPSTIQAHTPSTRSGFERVSTLKHIIPTLILLTAAVAIFVYPLILGSPFELLRDPVDGLGYMASGLFPICTAVVLILQWPWAKRLAAINFLLAFGLLAANRFSGIQNTSSLYHVTHAPIGLTYMVLRLISLAALLWISFSPDHPWERAAPRD
jgi:hypothetical protein